MRILTITLALLLQFVLFAEDGETRKVGNFSKIVAKSKFEVTLIQSEETKVVIHKLEESVDASLLITEVNNGTLEIYIKKKNFKDKAFHVTVYYKSLDEIEVRNDAAVITEPNQVIESDSISLVCKVGGKIKVAVKTPKLSAMIKSGGSILVQGEATNFHPNIQTGGRISSSKLKVENAWAEIKMGGEMIVRPKKLLDAKISMGGTIKYQGDPEVINQEIKAGGTVKKIK